MRVLELFAGTRSISRAFEKRGHETYSIEWNKEFPDISMYADISTVSAEDIKSLMGGGDSRRNMGISRLHDLFSNGDIETQGKGRGR